MKSQQWRSCWTCCGHDHRASVAVKLYKYFPPERTDVLRDLRIRFTQPADFNDPFDVLPNIEKLMPDGELEMFLAERENDVEAGILKELDKSLNLTSRGGSPAKLLEAFKKDTGIAPIALLKGILSEAPQAIRRSQGPRLQAGFGERFGILSLSEVPTSLLMWAHYSASHSGFVVEFDGDHEFFNQARFPGGAIGRVSKVSYATERPAITMFSPKANEVQWASRLIEQILMTKSVEWSYEQEWRMVLPLDDQSGYPHSALGELHLFPIPGDAVSGIVLGHRCNGSTRQDVLSAIQANVSLAPVALRQALISDRRYEVLIEPAS
jgi:Protein of unknown function (DUF2971)